MKLLFVCVLGLLLGKGVSKYVYYYQEGKVWNKCGYCYHPTHLKDEIPVLSYVLLKGKCRYCHRALSIVYPFLEIFNMCITLLIHHFVGFNLSFFVYSLGASVLLAFVVLDYKSLEVPISGLFLLLVCSVLSFLIHDKSVIDKIVGAFILSVPFLLVSKIHKESMGEADILLLSIVGLFFGASGVLVFACVSYLIAGVYVIVMLLIGKLKRSSKVAMMPFFFVGFLFQVIFNVSILLV